VLALNGYIGRFQRDLIAEKANAVSATLIWKVFVVFGVSGVHANTPLAESIVAPVVPKSSSLYVNG